MNRRMNSTKYGENQGMNKYESKHHRNKQIMISGKIELDL